MSSRGRYGCQATGAETRSNLRMELAFIPDSPTQSSLNHPHEWRCGDLPPSVG